MLQKFLLYYNGFESRPVFDSVEEMLKWSGLYGLTQRTLEEELIDAGLNSQTISELVTVSFNFFSPSSKLIAHSSLFWGYSELFYDALTVVYLKLPGT
jgi:hypothetical protein